MIDSKIFILQAFLGTCNLLSVLGSDGFSNNYVSERLLIIYLVCVCAHKAFQITEERKDILYMQKTFDQCYKPYI